MKQNPYIVYQPTYLALEDSTDSSDNVMCKWTILYAKAKRLSSDDPNSGDGRCPPWILHTTHTRNFSYGLSQILNTWALDSLKEGFLPGVDAFKANSNAQPRSLFHAFLKKRIVLFLYHQVKQTLSRFSNLAY